MTDNPRTWDLAICFLIATRRYWLNVYPAIRHESRHWHQLAEAIPDPRLRQLALQAQHDKRGNIEGSAALATFVDPEWRPTVIRTQVAFQTLYDYVDTLAEQPNREPLDNAKQLHQALLVALDADTRHENYYRHNPQTNDGGYLHTIIDTCCSGLQALPSYPASKPHLHKSAHRIVGYQTRNLTDRQGGHKHLEPWAEGLTPPGAKLYWWETAASAGSSLGLFALIAASSRPCLSDQEATAIEAAYWPWIGALHSLLDSLVDLEEDAILEQRNLLSYYKNQSETVQRLQTLAAAAKTASISLPRGHEHLLILAAMVGHYLTPAHTSRPLARQAQQSIARTLGSITTLTRCVLAARRAATFAGLRVQVPISHPTKGKVAPQQLTRRRPRPHERALAPSPGVGVSD
jgi:tetraprenyl-beta-curcumene synthase